MKHLILAASVVAVSATGAFAGAKGQVIIEDDVVDPFVPVASSSGPGLGTVAAVVGAAILLGALASGSDSDSSSSSTTTTD